MTKDVFENAKKLVDSVEFDCNGVMGKGGNGGLLSDTTIKAAGALRIALSRAEKQPPRQTETSDKPSEQNAAEDKKLLDALASNSWDLRCVSVPTGGDDCDIDWLVIEHHQAHPRERTIAQAYRDDPREAIRRAMRETDPKVERCVSCASVLHEGDSVYYEHGEGGHIHSWCAGDDAKSFVDEDEMPLKDDDPLPEPFAYKLEH